MKFGLSKILSKSLWPLKKTKVIATIGPASDNLEILSKHLKNGMNICRINFSHDDHTIQYKKFLTIKKAIKENPLYNNTAVMLDTKGPEIRTGKLSGGKKISLAKGDKLILTGDINFKGDKNKIAISYEDLTSSINIDSKILVADGLLSLKVTGKSRQKNEVYTVIQNDFILGEKKNVNLPKINLTIDTITEKDRHDIVDFGVKHGVDFIALSFTRTAQCIQNCRKIMGSKGKHIGVIAKIENHEGLENIEEILKVSDGIMIARGDLGMELEPEQLFVVQKYLTQKAHEFKKPVIVATQMLESMTENKRPTRAEITDVGNAVFDQNDAVMLSGETGGGQNPVLSLKTMTKICGHTEWNFKYDEIFKKNIVIPKNNLEALAIASVRQSLALQSGYIVVISEKPELVKFLSFLKPMCYIIFPHYDESLLRSLQVYFGVITVDVSKEAFGSREEVLKVVKKRVEDFKIDEISDSNILIESNELVVSII